MNGVHGKQRPSRPLQGASPAPQLIGRMLLEPRSLMVMRDALYWCMHGIEERSSDVIDAAVANSNQAAVEAGAVLVRGTRVSLTVRHVPKVRAVACLHGPGNATCTQAIKMPDIRLGKKAK